MTCPDSECKVLWVPKRWVWVALLVFIPTILGGGWIAGTRVADIEKLFLIAQESYAKRDTVQENKMTVEVIKQRLLNIERQQNQITDDSNTIKAVQQEILREIRRSRTPITPGDD